MAIKERIQIEFEKKNKMTLSKWWDKNGYKIMRVILFPIYLIVLLNEKRKDAAYKSLEYTDEKCKRYLDKVMPKMVARHCEDANEILISSCDDMGDIEFSDFRRCKNKKAARFFLRFSQKVKEYILEEYVIEGYKKMVLNNWTHWEKAKEKFDWGGTPCNQDYAVGVIFYQE